MEDGLNNIEENLSMLENKIQDISNSKEKFERDIDEVQKLSKHSEERINDHQHLITDKTKRLMFPYIVSDILYGTAPATAGNYGHFFINHSQRTLRVTQVNVVWSTASTSGTVMLERLQGTEAKDAGDDLFVSAQSTAGTANTVATPALIIVTPEKLNILPGNRLGLVNGGTLTNGTDLVVTVNLEEVI